MDLKQPDLGQALRTLREIRGEGIQTTAAHAGISKGLLSRIERGQDVQLSTLNKLLPALGLKATVAAGRHVV